jgi:hypothetical protein
MIIDYYFRNPILIDYSIAIGAATGIFWVWDKYNISLPKIDQSISVLTDLTTISLTLAGFILTLLTVLITFKSGSKAEKLEVDSNEPLFDMFFATGLYFETVRHLKNCIKSLIFIGFVGFTLKLGVLIFIQTEIFYFNAFSIIIILLSAYRCLLILGTVLNLQKSSFDKRDDRYN